MDKSIKEKKNLELTLKTILYCVEDVNEQNKMIDILKECNNKFPDGRLKDGIQNWLLKHKDNYYDQVDYLIKDIMEGKLDNEKRKAISEMIIALKPIAETGQRNFWDKLIDLFTWS